MQAILIPYDGSDAKKVKLLTFRAAIQEEPAGSRRCEEYLRFIPDPLDYEDWASHAWLRRSLVDLGNLDPNEQGRDPRYPRGPYFMYKCSVSGSAECPPNEYFMRAMDLLGIKGVPGVYGNAFIFKIKMPASDGYRVKYDHVDSDQMYNLFQRNGYTPPEIIAWLAKQ